MVILGSFLPRNYFTFYRNNIVFGIKLQLRSSSIKRYYSFRPIASYRDASGEDTNAHTHAHLFLLKWSITLSEIACRLPGFQRGKDRITIIVKSIGVSSPGNIYVHDWTRRGHASVTVGVCFYLVERSRSARRKEPRRACSEQTNRNKPLEAGGVHCIISSAKVKQEPQRMRHRTTLFSARTLNDARARNPPPPPPPTKKEKSPKIDYIQNKSMLDLKSQSR